MSLYISDGIYRHRVTYSATQNKIYLQRLEISATLNWTLLYTQIAGTFYCSACLSAKSHATENS